MAFTLEIGKAAPDFSLPATDGKIYSLKDFEKSRILVIVFICNHCPSVIGIQNRLNKLYDSYNYQGVSVIAINSNATEHEAEDSFEHMKTRSVEAGYQFPYLRDEDQSVAKAYGAIKTPHFFVVDQDRTIQYTGRMNDSPKDETQAKTQELIDSLSELIFGVPVSTPVTEPLGCTIKWKGKDRKFIPNDACDL